MCQCAVNPLDVVKRRAPAFETVDYRVVDTLPPKCHKACTVTATGEILVHRPYWERFDADQKRAAIAHELGHVSGADCEHHADFIAGGILRQWGYSLDAAKRAMRRVVTNRGGAGVACEMGWRACGHAPKSLDWRGSGKAAYRPGSTTGTVYGSERTPVTTTIISGSASVVGGGGATSPATTTATVVGTQRQPVGAPETGSGGGGGGGGGGSSTGAPQDASQGPSLLVPLVALGALVLILGGGQ